MLLGVADVALYWWPRGWWVVGIAVALVTQVGRLVGSTVLVALVGRWVLPTGKEALVGSTVAGALVGLCLLHRISLITHCLPGSCSLFGKMEILEQLQFLCQLLHLEFLRQ